MAVTIVRTNWIDDDGSGTTGTVLNNAIKTELYGQIDGALAQLVASNEVLNITGFGVHQISAGGTGQNSLLVINTTSGTANYARVAANAGTTDISIHAFSQNYTTGTWDVQSAGALYGAGTGGISVAAIGGAIRFYSGGTILRGVVETDGRWGIPTGITSATVGISAQPSRTAINAAAQTDGFPAIQGIQSSNSAAGYVAHFTNSGSGTGLFLGNTAAWQSTSDGRLKTDLRDLDALDGLRQIRPRDFLFRSQATSDTPQRRNYGFVAQEVESVFPDLVRPGPDGLLTMEYTGIIAPLVQGWQDHDRRLARLESLVSEKD